MKLLFYGDPHGEWRPLHYAVEQLRPDKVILLGDMDLDRPLEQEVMSFSEQILWIHGNHDCHSLARVGWYDNLFNSALADRSLHARVVEVAGLRLAGLGGHFQQNIWHPDRNIRFANREQWLRANPVSARWRDDLPIKARAAIWWEDYERLYEQQADILVLHEAPGSHRFGFSVLDELAEAMGAKWIVHGHHHENYDATIGDIKVHGVGKATAWLLQIGGAEQ
jgi:predicted phosphodiesterase